jgi:hypothetical protein
MSGRPQFDQLQLGLLDAAASILEVILKGELDSDLGVNFMHVLPSSPKLREMVRDRTGELHPSSIDAYGKCIAACTRVLYVGPTSEAALPFAKFIVPMYDDVERVLPGAPRAMWSKQPQVLYGSECRLEPTWPRGLPPAHRDELVKFFASTGFKFCLSLPVLAQTDTGKEVVGVLNINTRSEPLPSVAGALASHIDQVLKPLLVLLGSVEQARRAANALPLT